MLPIVGLLTDFGTRDSYVGALKGALLSVRAELQIVDITHEIDPQDVTAGALCLADCYRHFPLGTTFLAVVDPGVGSSRRGLAVAAGGYRFVGPDNGILTSPLLEHRDASAFAIVNAALFRLPVSATFHGRDVFAPVAARIATGLALSEVGPSVDDPALLELPGLLASDGGGWEAVVIGIDRFGNAVTSGVAPELEQIFGVPLTGRLVVAVGERVVPVVSCYADGRPGEAVALVGSGGRLEVSISGGNAATLLALKRGSRIRLSPK